MSYKMFLTNCDSNKGVTTLPPVSSFSLSKKQAEWYTFKNIFTLKNQVGIDKLNTYDI
jgi:hypothetical protein